MERYHILLRNTLLAHKIVIDKNHDTQESYIKLVLTK